MSKLLTLAALLIPATGDSVRPGAHPAAPPSRFAPMSSIELWTDPGDVLQPNDQVRVYFRSEFDAYMTVLRVDTDGRIQVLFPGTPWRNNWVRAQREYEVKPGPERYTFLVDDYPGQGFILAVASAGPFRYDALVAGEEWDFRALGEGGWIKGDPYEALMQIIDDIVPDSSARYDYDVLPYDVGEDHEYPRFLCYDCHAHAAYPTWNPYDRACKRVRLIIYNDPYYYPTRITRATRVVFTRPRRLEPRFVFEHRQPGRPYIDHAQRERLPPAVRR